MGSASEVTVISLLFNSFYIHTQTHLKLQFSLLMSSFVPGEFGPQWLACDFSLRRWPGRDEGGCHQCWSGDHGERGQGLPETGAGKPDGRLEVLHLLWFSGLSTVAWDTGGDVLGIYCSVHEHEVCMNHDVDMSLFWTCNRKHSWRISSHIFQTHIRWILLRSWM